MDFSADPSKMSRTELEERVVRFNLQQAELFEYLYDDNTPKEVRYKLRTIIIEPARSAKGIDCEWRPDDDAD